MTRLMTHTEAVYATILPMGTGAGTPSSAPHIGTHSPHSTQTAASGTPRARNFARHSCPGVVPDAAKRSHPLPARSISVTLLAMTAMRSGARRHTPA